MQQITVLIRQHSAIDSLGLSGRRLDRAEDRQRWPVTHVTTNAGTLATLGGLQQT